MVLVTEAQIGHIRLFYSHIRIYRYTYHWLQSKHMEMVMISDIVGLMKDCSISTALAIEMLQSYTQTSIW